MHWIVIEVSFPAIITFLQLTSEYKLKFEFSHVILLKPMLVIPQLGGYKGFLHDNTH